ncbi:hypothetical protein jhhlp_001954 [Lomentospora prolificans]|uniref:Pre-rRNA-processing protein RIX1 n=1 Tax=Lomentospora prolificans TaxID=41688 RepID=A0A2N3NCM1_9PEZI|nr:hypothetical protein jhhlp_001954 [Lomentospora prolificans]
MSLPPDLRVLCHQLTSSTISPARLAQSAHVLTNHVLQCAEALSAPQDSKLRDNASEAAVLVHKLKTALKTLLNDRDHRRRFTGVVLVKAVIDVGGWECLRSSEPWVRGLIAVLQKKDPLASKELAVVTLTRIYNQLHGYQTLVREIATPTIPGFITACLHLLKSPAPGQPPHTPLNVVETIVGSLSTIIPLYPTTSRPFVSQIRTSIRIYLVPTLSDELSVPSTLQSGSRRLAIALHYTASKSGGSDEWAALLAGIVKNFHSTADQVFRSVKETWEPPPGYTASKITLGQEPRGGGDSADTLPSWSGITPGCQRLIGLLDFMAEFIRQPTKSQISIPVGVLVDVVCRVAQIARHTPKSQTWEQALETNPAISKEERDELWSAIPSIHVAALELLLTLCQRLRRSFVPVVPETLDYLVRVFKSGISTASVRCISYRLLADILPLNGPTMGQDTVSTFDLIIRACCRDLQQETGYLKPPAQPTPNTNKNGVVMNADLFLSQKTNDTSVAAPTLEPAHSLAADRLLASFLSYLPQHHLRPALRGLLDQTAILTRNRDAMLASVLNPFRNKQSKMYPSILPFLSQLCPNDQALEILRSNMRTSQPSDSSSFSVFKETNGTDNDTEDQDHDVEMEGDPTSTASSLKMADELEVSPPGEDAAFEAVPVVDKTPKENPFAPRTADEASTYVSTPASPLGASSKRKSDDEAEGMKPVKKMHHDVSEDEGMDTPPALAAPAAAVEDDDSDDESVRLVASFDSDPEMDEAD